MMNNIAPRIVEIVGPAGAGKTTLCHALSHGNESIHWAIFPMYEKFLLRLSLSGTDFKYFSLFSIFPAKKAENLPVGNLHGCPF